jgi:steroid delta-isomerase-like uncharacterized protein
VSASENKAVAERLLEAFNASDYDQIRGIFTPDFVNHNPPPFPGATPDVDGMIRTMQMFRGAFPDANGELVRTIGEGDIVVLHDIVRGTHEGEWMGVPATAREVEVEFIHIFRIADGLIAERWGLVDGMGLMMQLGAIPEPAGVGQAR